MLNILFMIRILYTLIIHLYIFIVYHKSQQIIILSKICCVSIFEQG